MKRPGPGRSSGGERSNSLERLGPALCRNQMADRFGLIQIDAAV